MVSQEHSFFWYKIMQNFIPIGTILMKKILLNHQRDKLRRNLPHVCCTTSFSVNDFKFTLQNTGPERGGLPYVRKGDAH